MFVWHSSNTEESAAVLAQALECEHGKVPPKGYEGDVICLGANPADNFKWNDRNFGRIVNDPRKLKKFKNVETVTTAIGVARVGESVRVVCVNGKITKVVGENVILPPAIITFIESGILDSLDNPEFVAIDGVLTKNGASFIVTKVVFGPAITELPDVIQKLKDEFNEVDDKTALQNLVNSASESELKALRNLLRKMKNEA